MRKETKKMMKDAARETEGSPAKAALPRLRSRAAGLGTAGAMAFFSRRRIATACAIVFAGLLAYHVVFGANGLSAYQQKRDEDRILQGQIRDLQQENSRLKEHVENLKSDPDTIEHEARTILHYTRPGEVIYKLDTDKTTTSEAAPAAGAPRSR